MKTQIKYIVENHRGLTNSNLEKELEVLTYGVQIELLQRLQKLTDEQIKDRTQIMIKLAMEIKNE